ncbi:hypothetical protein DB347_24090 [Opitutaceae bacterium EW11]|nr:hypothetical protein DB347_24090 [Opitutaceae bacterium EW11]
MLRTLLALTALAFATVPRLGAVPSSPLAVVPGAHPATNLPGEDDAFLDDLQRASFKFFAEQTHPITGLVRDRARADGSPSEGKASVSVSGFALSAWVVATHRGWTGRTEALEQVRGMLRFLATQAPREHGFFYHFMEMDTGERSWKCELSSIDTALMLAGAIVAREYFQDPEITALVNQLYEEVDWQWFLNGGETVSLGWHPETGFSRYRWNNYSEHLMMSFLALGAPRHSLDSKYWRAWARQPVGTYAGLHYIQQAPLFIHQFAHCYVDFRGRRDAYADYYRNSFLATLAQRQFCIDLRKEFPSWSDRLWGISASDSATGYKAWGGPPRTLQFNALDGTIVPCAAAGAVPFAPYESMLTLRHMRTIYGEKIWSRYGFVDAFNPQTGWVNADVLGIDVGITLLQAENARSGLIWALFMQAPEVRKAIQKAGLVSTNRVLSLDDSRFIRGLAVQAWQSLASTTAEPSNAGLHLTGILAAHALGFLSTDDTLARARSFLAQSFHPTDDVALSQFAAALITLRQALPALEADATRVLETIDWSRIHLSATQLGSGSRLAAFLQFASGSGPSTVWTDLTREPVRVGPVYSLAPAEPAAQLLPGLWLDEQATITGASASQYAYAQLIADTEGPQPPHLHDVISTALLLDRFPSESAQRLKAMRPTPDWLASAPPAQRAAFLIVVANVLVPDCTREWFQQDPLVLRGRSALKEFVQAPFGRDTSLAARFELSGPLQATPERRGIALRADTPREQWDWHKLAGLEYKDSEADVLPGDPSLEMRFAFTWDNTALYLHAEVMDSPAGYKMPADSNRYVELMVDAVGDQLVWMGKDDYRFYFMQDGNVREWFHGVSASATVKQGSTGYSVDAAIPWKSFGVTPHPGLELGVSPAAMREGTKEWEPTLKLSWNYQRQSDEHVVLGLLRLQ